MDGKKIAVKSTPKQHSRHDIWELGFRTAHGKVTSRSQPTVNSIVCLISQQLKSFHWDFFQPTVLNGEKKNKITSTHAEI